MLFLFVSIIISFAMIIFAFKNVLMSSKLLSTDRFRERKLLNQKAWRHILQCLICIAVKNIFTTLSRSYCKYFLKLAYLICYEITIIIFFDEIKNFLTYLLVVYLLLINFEILNYPKIFQTIYIQLYNLKLLKLCY